MSEPGGGEYEMKRWLVPIGSLDEKDTYEQSTVIMMDPHNPNTSTREHKGSTDVLVPPYSPIGSLVVALSPGTPSPQGKEGKPIIQIFEVVVTKEGAKALKSVLINDDNLEAVKKAAELELISDSKKPKASMVTRKLEPETATSYILTQPKAITDASLCQRLPSQSPHISLGFVTAADYNELKTQISANKPAKAVTPIKSAPIQVNVPIVV